MLSITSIRTLMFLYVASMTSLKIDDYFLFLPMFLGATIGCLFPLTCVVKSKSPRLMIVRHCDGLGSNNCEILSSWSHYQLDWMSNLYLGWIVGLLGWSPLEQNHLHAILASMDKVQGSVLTIISWLVGNSTLGAYRSFKCSGTFTFLSPWKDSTTLEQSSLKCYCRWSLSHSCEHFYTCKNVHNEAHNDGASLT